LVLLGVQSRFDPEGFGGSVRTIEWAISTGFAGGVYRGEFEVEEDVSDDDIDEMVQDELNNRIYSSWKVRE
jgi:hypothetical protein